MNVARLDAGTIELAGRTYSVSVNIYVDGASGAIQRIEHDSQHKGFDADHARERRELEPLEYTTVHFTEVAR